MSWQKVRARGSRRHTRNCCGSSKGLDHHDVQPKPIRRTTHHQVPRYTRIYRADIWGAFVSSHITGKEVLEGPTQEVSATAGQARILAKISGNKESLIARYSQAVESWIDMQKEPERGCPRAACLSHS